MSEEDTPKQLEILEERKLAKLAGIPAQLSKIFESGTNQDTIRHSYVEV
jgi:hypothetical protein